MLSKPTSAATVHGHDGRLVQGDRTVHARLPNGLEVVRYDRAGKWYEESPDQRRLLTLDHAITVALMPGAYVYLGLPGGKSFDAKVRHRRGF